MSIWTPITARMIPIKRVTTLIAFWPRNFTSESLAMKAAKVSRHTSAKAERTRTISGSVESAAKFMAVAIVPGPARMGSAKGVMGNGKRVRARGMDC